MHSAFTDAGVSLEQGLCERGQLIQPSADVCEAGVGAVLGRPDERRQALRDCPCDQGLLSLPSPSCAFVVELNSSDPPV